MEILVVYSGFTRRPTLLEGLLCYERYSGCKVSYYNTRLPFADILVKRRNFDLVIFSTLFFSRRIHKHGFQRDTAAASWISKLSAVKVATPQDEYINSKYVNDFIDRIGISTVYTVQPKSVWDKVYPNAKSRGVKLRPALTGYLDDTLVADVIREDLFPLTGRKIDIGYRTTGVPPVWYGRHAVLKIEIANRVKPVAIQRGLTVDISTSPDDTIANESWYQFLGGCRYTIGVEGGTSIIDFDGSIKDAVEKYIANNSNAQYDEVEKNCFPGLDGTFSGFALSPRHLEACMTRTCQILIEGDYNGVLQPWKHYIPLKRDFSNLEQVFDLFQDERLRKEIVDRAFVEIVKSGNYLISSMVKSLINDVRTDVSPKFKKIIRAIEILQPLSNAYNRPASVVVLVVEVIRFLKKKTASFSRRLSLV